MNQETNCRVIARNVLMNNDTRATGINNNDHLKLFRHTEQNQIFYQTYFKLGYDDNYKIISYDTELAQKCF